MRSHGSIGICSERCRRQSPPPLAHFSQAILDGTAASVTFRNLVPALVPVCLRKGSSWLGRCWCCCRACLRSRLSAAKAAAAVESICTETHESPRPRRTLTPSPRHTIPVAHPLPPVSRQQQARQRSRPDSRLLQAVEPSVRASLRSSRHRAAFDSRGCESTTRRHCRGPLRAECHRANREPRNCPPRDYNSSAEPPPNKSFPRAATLPTQQLLPLRPVRDRLLPVHPVAAPGKLAKRVSQDVRPQAT